MLTQVFLMKKKNLYETPIAEVVVISPENKYILTSGEVEIEDGGDD